MLVIEEPCLIIVKNSVKLEMWGNKWIKDLFFRPSCLVWKTTVRFRLLPIAVFSVKCRPSRKMRALQSSGSSPFTKSIVFAWRFFYQCRKNLVLGCMNLKYWDILVQICGYRLRNILQIVGSYRYPTDCNPSDCRLWICGFLVGTDLCKISYIFLSNLRSL